MNSTGSQDEAWEERRRVLGERYMSRVADDIAENGDEFQEYLTSVVWSRWARTGLATRDRSLVVLAMTAALGRLEEFALHVTTASRAGVTDAEIDELLMQITAYCGAPAGVSARRVVLAIRSDINSHPRR